ncbi:MAG: SDR family NAD(P)-dependent oxidoreductase [Gammaproteobacteria bacterium]|nr:SDR family NAD(P)-dependent oxidoreductase [Gammaproteobacteria bacterium]
MELTKHDVAVITGAGSGIGKATAIAMAQKGVDLALMDVNADGLNATRAVAESHGVRALCEVLDVSNRQAVLAFADATYEKYGKVNVLFNNAAVNGIMAPAWRLPNDDWHWVMAVDFFGVIHGIEGFLPRMVESGAKGIVINTTSIGGIISGPTSAYSVAKHAITRLTEGLHYDFAQHAPSMQAALLVPGPINSGINASWGAMLDDSVRSQISDEEFNVMAEASQGIAAMVEQIGMEPEEVATIVLDAIEQDEFYIYTHPEAIKEMAKLRFDDFLSAKQPSRQAGDVEGMFAKWATDGVR